MENIIIVDPIDLERKINKIIRDGPSMLYILSDFDRTLTKAFYNSKKTSSLISKLRDKDYLSKEYSTAAHALFDEYHPIEIDPKIPIHIKLKKMEEWWKKHMELLIKSGIDLKIIRKCVKDIIKENTLNFRYGVKEFLNKLKSNNIPLIIISTSLSDLIKEYMIEKIENSQNVYIIGNNFKFDKKGKAVSYEKIINTFNKHEFEFRNLSIYKELLKRKNVILLGDSLGDIGMVKGFPYENIIRIGFLNENIEGNLGIFKENFDIIITNDGDFDFINVMINRILNQKV